MSIIDDVDNIYEVDEFNASTEMILTHRKIYKDIYYVYIPRMATYTREKLEAFGVSLTKDKDGNLSSNDEMETLVGLSIYDIAIVASRGYSVRLELRNNLEKTIIGIYDSIRHFQEYYEYRKGLNEIDYRHIGNSGKVLKEFKDMIYNGHKAYIDKFMNKDHVNRNTLPTFDENDTTGEEIKITYG